jgi:hypothetical protein
VNANCSSSTARTNSRDIYPLFGLAELVNITATWPKVPAMDAAFQDRPIPYAQCYSPTVKGMENRVPLLAYPNLLTYMFGEAYMSQSTRFRQVWEEVNTQRTLQEILEVFRPTVALDARLEMVVNDVDTSFLASFRHRHLARAVVKGGFLVKVRVQSPLLLYPDFMLFYVHNMLQVPARDFAGYVGALVKELYGPLEAAVKGTLTGPGTLGTVLLCESLLRYLPSGTALDQPRYLFKAYDILPLSRLKATRKIDLKRFATIRNGVLYIRRPAFQRIWIPTTALPNSARASAYSMLNFLEKLRAGRQSVEAITRSAAIIVAQFKQDLKEMGVVRDLQMFSSGVVAHGCIRDAQTADEYVSRAFVPKHLPSRMTTKAFLSVAVDLFNPLELHRKLVHNLLSSTRVVPQAIVHAGAVDFSPTFRSVLIGGSVSAATVSPSDAYQLVAAATQLLRENFRLSRKEMRSIQKHRSRLTSCVVEAVRKARSRTGCLRHVLRVVAYATMFLAEKEGLLSWKPNYRKLYGSNNLNRYILQREMKEIVTAILATEERSLEGAGGRRKQIALSSIPRCNVVLDRVIVSTQH